ncbi:ABC transporter permease subunit [Bosea psychrotolerans]|uniref:ABC-type spermidine/putrescine transport system permease subunit I n=1 Tax=Bosea psychrotolerans TaxID=1871628 RepID=A0A2S4M1Y2_9HYPH|nr:ABC transporter permease subunit [Bosea psychrotolerans]POR48688.1 ABC-type spermidine/putrescine transport system permease subunit I [Bosea psychrotolerans]
MTVIATSEGRSRSAVGQGFPVWLGLAPFALVLAVLFAAPVLSLLRLAFGEGAFTLAQFQRLIDVPVYRSVLGTTFGIAGLVTGLSVLVSYPLAYVMATVGPRTRNLLLILVLLPFWTSALVRTTAWIILLQSNGVVNQLLMAGGLTASPIAFVYNLSGVLIGMTHVLMPFVVLPLYAAFRNLELSTVQAAESLGAGPLTIFSRIILPLTAPGVVAGAMIVFMNAIGFYLTPALMGGPGQTMIAQMIATNINKELDWPFAAALASVLLVATVSLLALFQRRFGLDRLIEGGGGKAGEPFTVTSRGRSWGGWATVVAAVLVAAFLIAPIVIVFPMSLGSSPFLSFPPDSYSLVWYENFFSTSKWMAALTRSLQIAALVVVISVGLGTLAALGVSRMRPRWRALVETLFILPMIVPVIILAVGLYYLLAPTGLVGSIWGVTLGHVVLATPYVFITVRAALKSFDGNLELAALGLGASWPTMFRRVMLPGIAPGIAAGAIFAFITSFDDVVIALFLTNIRSRTLPKLMYEGVAHEIDPTIIAASCLIILVTILVLGANLLVSKRT